MESISDRATEFFRLHSITARLDDISGRVYVTTSAPVQFSIQLWKSSSGKHKTDYHNHDPGQPSTHSSTTLIIHIERISGDALTFARTRHGFFEAMKNTKMGRITRQEDESTTHGRLSDFVSKEEEEELDQHLTVDHSDSYMSSIEICIQLLQSPTEHYWGMESLVAMTDASTTILSEVIRVSRFVLTDVGLQQILTRHLLLRSTDGGKSHMMMNFHILTLKILAQALEYLPNIRRTMTPDWNSPFWQVLLNVFHQHIIDNPTKPLEASLSIRCLRALHRWCPPTTDIPMPNEATLWAAYYQGRQRHLMLELESKSLLEGLGISVV